MAGRRSWSSVLEALVLLQCFICVAFVATVAILEAGLSMTDSKQCHAAIRSCIALYACGKVALWVDMISYTPMIPLTRIIDICSSMSVYTSFERLS